MASQTGSTLFAGTPGNTTLSSLLASTSSTTKYRSARKEPTFTDDYISVVTGLNASDTDCTLRQLSMVGIGDIWANVDVKVTYAVPRNVSEHDSATVDVICEANLVVAVRAPSQLSWPALARALAAGPEALRRPRPELSICLGPLYNFGKDIRYFARYLIDYLEHHRALGVARIVLYVAARHPTEGEATLFQAIQRLYPNDMTKKFAVAVVNATMLERTVNSFYHNQYVVINDCLNRNKDANRFVFVCDVDELITLQQYSHSTSANSALLVQALENLANIKVNATNFAFTTMEDHLMQPQVCEQHGTGVPDIAAASASRRETAGHSPLALAGPHYCINLTCSNSDSCGGARRKSIALAAGVEAVGVAVHLPWGSELGSGPSPTAVGLLKVHARHVPFRPPECKQWASDWQQSKFPLSSLIMRSFFEEPAFRAAADQKRAQLDQVWSSPNLAQ